MASNSFGNIFKVTTWGESHGKAIGVVIDGCPAGLALKEEDVQQELALRNPGRNDYTSSRAEPDHAEIYSGLFEGKTTGTPISIIIFNKDAHSAAYEPIKNILRPGHANFTYLEKYGTFDYRGGGRASARETACRVAAGAVAKKLLRHFSIETCAYLTAVADIEAHIEHQKINQLRELVYASPVFCPDSAAAAKIMQKITALKQEGDSTGGIVTFLATGIPVGLGDPMYEKLQANLAKMMLSLNAVKAFEMGEGFHAAVMKGSEHNDLFTVNSEKSKNIGLNTNHAGGLLAGISNGMPLYGRVAFKPAASIQKTQKTLDLEGNPVILQLPAGSRHDPCVAIRAVPVVDAMCALVLADALLMNRCVKL